MLTASPIQSKEEQERLCLICNIPYRPNAFAYSQKDGEKVIAVSQFDVNSSGGIIYDLRMSSDTDEDTEALFILGRAVLNFLDIIKTDTCFFAAKNEHDEKIAKMLGFKKSNEQWTINLRGLFEKKCHI